VRPALRWSVKICKLRCETLTKGLGDLGDRGDGKVMMKLNE
jgi:hypothetical protein